MMHGTMSLKKEEEEEGKNILPLLGFEPRVDQSVTYSVWLWMIMFLTVTPSASHEQNSVWLTHDLELSLVRSTAIWFQSQSAFVDRCLGLCVWFALRRANIWRQTRAVANLHFVHSMSIQPEASKSRNIPNARIFTASVKPQATCSLLCVTPEQTNSCLNCLVYTDAAALRWLRRLDRRTATTEARVWCQASLCFTFGGPS